MALDVMQIYQENSGLEKKQGNENNNLNIKEKDGDKDGKANKEEGASFWQDGAEVKACFKCGAKDYKVCSGDNLKRLEKGNRKGKTEPMKMKSNIFRLKNLMMKLSAFIKIHFLSKA